MKFREIFGNAEYVRADRECNYPYVRKTFSVSEKIKSAKVTVSVLGFFEIYFNGKKLTDDLYITTLSQYNRMPPNEVSGSKNIPQFDDDLGFTVYVSEFDVTDLVTENNVLGFIVAGGWYRTGANKYGNVRNYGRPKLAFRVDIETQDGEKIEIFSDGTCKWKESFLVDATLYHEEQDERKDIPNFSTLDCSDTYWEKVAIAEPQPDDVKYFYEVCPRNKIMDTVKPILIKETANEKIYKLPTNFTGYPVIEGKSKRGDVIVCDMGETLDEDGSINEFHSYAQRSIFTSDGRDKHYIRFTWHGFQYFSIKTTGDVKDLYVNECKLVHADLKNTSGFKCDNAVINFIYDAYVRTQLQNYQCGVPCDCPQIERKGYTGDGQLLGELGMLLFNSQSFYRKWINDIADTQDKKTGFVDYTAPTYYGPAGGPGGWSVAIINVPYQYYKRFGDRTVLEEYYPNMIKFLDFLDSEQIDGLVAIHKRKSTRCLGDWSGPYQPFISEPFVNTCLCIETLNYLIEIAKVLGREEDIPAIEKRVQAFKNAVDKKYFDNDTGDYLGGEQAANAFALNVGLGDERTLNNLNKRYQQMKWMDVGIFGLKLLPKTLFKNGYQDTAIDLYTSEHPISFKSMMDDGATTLYEAWIDARSRNHPMYGVAVLWIFEYVLGIRQKQGSAGYKDVIINPANCKKLNQVSGFVTLDGGQLSVSFAKENGVCKFDITVPDGVNCEFEFVGVHKTLSKGKNTFTVTIAE